jgi:hypothetical protein
MKSNGVVVFDHGSSKMCSIVGINIDTIDIILYNNHGGRSKFKMVGSHCEIHTEMQLIARKSRGARLPQFDKSL